jgi:hypothetical protein
MKFTSRKPFSRNAIRTAIALAVAGGCAGVYALTGTAQAATPGKTAVERAAASGWHLQVNVQPGLSSVAVCELAAPLVGHDCTVWTGFTSSKWQLLAATTKTYTGRVTLIWNPGWYEFNSSTDSAYAQRGHWNFCSLPAGSGTLHVTAANGVPNCD